MNRQISRVILHAILYFYVLVFIPTLYVFFRCGMFPIVSLISKLLEFKLNIHVLYITPLLRH